MQMSFDEALREVKRRVPCINYLSKAPRGGYICPFCGSGTGPNKTGALEYYPETNSFSCHACNKSGDPVDLDMQAEGRGFRDSVAVLAGSIGIEIDQANKPKSKIRGLRGSQSDFNSQRHNLPRESKQKEIGANMSAKKANIKDRFKDYCERCRADVGKTDFFHERGLSDSTIEHNLLGYDARAGVVVFPYNRDYSYIETRKVNPREGERKYKKPSEADAGGKEPVYKAEALYRSKPCFVCEGAFDALAIYEAGGNACAIGGGGSNKLIDQLYERWPTSPIILFFDTGKQGQEDTKSASEKLEAAGIPYSVAKIDLSKYGRENEADTDPNDLLLANRAQFEADIKANEAEAVPVSDIAQFMISCYTEKYKPIPTGIEGLDKLLDGGLMRQTLSILMAEPGTGKTILAAQIFENLAKSGTPCLYFNLEMSKEQMIARSLSRLCYTELNSKVSVRAILRGYEQGEVTRATVEKAANRYNKKIGGYLRYNPGTAGADLAAILKYIEAIGENARAHGVQAPAICLDYLHLLSGQGNEDSREIIKKAVAGFKDYAERYDAIVLLISAQNRPANESKKPSLSAGRDSSAIEYSGDLIMQLIRDEDNEGDYNKISLHVVKSRFTESNKSDHLDFNLYGDYAYLEPVGEWVQGNTADTPYSETGGDGTYRETV